MEKAVPINWAGHLKFTYKGRPRVADATLELTPTDKGWSCNLVVTYAQKRYITTFPLASVPKDRSEELVAAIFARVLLAVRSWGKPWSELRGSEQEVVVQLSPVRDRR